MACALSYYEFDAGAPGLAALRERIVTLAGHEEGVALDGECLRVGDDTFYLHEGHLAFESFGSMSLKHEHLLGAVDRALAEWGARVGSAAGPRPRPVEAPRAAWLNGPWSQVPRWRKLVRPITSVGIVVFVVPLVLFVALLLSLFQRRRGQGR